MGFSMQPGSKGERTAVALTGLGTGVIVGVVEKYWPKFSTGTTIGMAIVGSGFMLMGKGVGATIGEGMATGSLALLGAMAPSAFSKSGATTTARRVSTPVHMATRVDARQTQNITPLS